MPQSLAQPVSPRVCWTPRALRTGLLAVVLLLATACGGASELEEIRSLQAAGNFGATVEPLRSLLEQDPGNGELHLLYGIALAKTGNPSLALWSLHEARRDEALFLVASLALAQAANSAQDHRVAIEAASAVLEREPDHISALSLRGEARLANGIDPEGALEDLARVLEQSPDDVVARLAHLRALLAAERVEEAEAALAEVERIASEGTATTDNAMICTVGASFALERGDPEQAETLYEKCLVDHPGSPLVLDGAIGFFDGRGDFARGTETLRAFSERIPHSAAHRGRLAQRLRASGEMEAAEQLLREATGSEDAATRAHAWSALTDHFIAVGDLPSAVEAFESAIEYEGELSVNRRLAYADLLAGAGLNERALEVAAALQEPAVGDLIRGRVALNQARPCEALRFYEGAFPQWPNNAVARYYAGRAAEQCGDFDGAFEHYRQSIRSGSKSSDSGLRLARLMWAEGRLNDALYGVQHHLEADPRNPEMVLLKTRIALKLQSIVTLQNLLASLPPSRLRARVMVIFAAHLSAEQGPEVAMNGLRSDPNLDLLRPRDAPALGQLLELLLAAGRPEAAHGVLAKALETHPTAADFHYERARLLEREEADLAERIAAFEQAAALDPTHAGALLALGRHAGERGEVDEALLLFDRSAAADLSTATPAREAAQLLAAVGRNEEAEERLDALLREFAYDAAAALTRATLGLASDGPSDRHYELARRAVRFGGGPAAAELLSNIESQRANLPQGAAAIAR